MDKQDKERRDEFKKHEMEKEHKRREHLKEMDEKARKEEELKFEALRQKHLNASKNLHHPVSSFLQSKAQFLNHTYWLMQLILKISRSHNQDNVRVNLDGTTWYSVACNKLSSLRHKWFLVNQTYSLLAIVLYDTKML